MAYNTTAQNIQAFQNITNSKELLVATNTTINGMLGIGIWLMVVVPLFLYLKSKGSSSSDSFVAVSFLGFVLSIFLRGMTIIADPFFYFNIVLVGIAVVVAVVSKNS